MQYNPLYVVFGAGTCICCCTNVTYYAMVFAVVVLFSYWIVLNCLLFACLELLLKRLCGDRVCDKKYVNHRRADILHFCTCSCLFSLLLVHGIAVYFVNIRLCCWFILWWLLENLLSKCVAKYVDRFPSYVKIHVKVTYTRVVPEISYKTA